MVAQDVHRYIADHLHPYAELQMDGLSQDRDSITVIQGRGQPIVTNYMDRSISGQFDFDIRARSKNRIRANRWIQGVVDHFTAHPHIQLSVQTFFTATASASPYLIERTDQGEYVYAASFSVEYNQF